MKGKDSTVAQSTHRTTTKSKYPNVDTEHIPLSTKVITKMDAITPMLFFKRNSQPNRTCVKSRKRDKKIKEKGGK